jgi:hypothetical protein
MRKGDQLRLRDVRDAYRLIGDCRDLGGEPELWQTRMFAGLCQLIGATVGTGGEGLWRRPTHPIQPLSAFEVGLDARGRERFMADVRENRPQCDPIFRALATVRGRVLIWCDRQSSRTRCGMVRALSMTTENPPV